MNYAQYDALDETRAKIEALEATLNALAVTVENLERLEREREERLRNLLSECLQDFTDRRHDTDPTYFKVGIEEDKS